MKLKKSIQNFVEILQRNVTDFLSKANKPASIRSKLVAAFMVPILLIVMLGIVSYLKSSDAVFRIARDSTTATMDSTSKYIQSVFSNIEDTSMQVLTDPDLQRYLLPESPKSEKTDTETDYLTSFMAKQKIEQRISSLITGNKIIADISIIAAEGKSITPTGIYKGAIIDKLKDTELGKKFRMRINHLFG